MSISVLLADDHPMFRKGLRLLIEEEPEVSVVGEAGDEKEAIERVRELSPDVVVMDISMPDLNGIEATRQIQSHSPNTKVVALSIHAGKQFVKDMLSAGAAGYILKDSVPEEIINGIRKVMDNDVYLSSAITGVVVSKFLEGDIAKSTSEEPDQWAADEPFVILRTKLHRLLLSPDLVPRLQLLARLDELRHRPVTLVSSAAGYGKSTMASLWLEAWDGPYAWVSLDVDENDLRMFSHYLLAAIRNAFPKSCRPTRSLLQGAQLPPLTVLSRYLLNDLVEIKDRFILVLDDYHRIREKAVHDLVAAILAHPPQNLHLMLLTRRDPLLLTSTMRGRGQVNEIGTLDLQFTAAETAVFLKNTLGLSVDEKRAAIIQDKLEGWPAGMRLMSEVLKQSGDLDRLMAGLKGGFAAILDYLMAEVLSQQSPEMTSLMAATAILDRFCAPLCDALHELDAAPGPGEIDGAEFIAKLQKDNLFLIALDVENTWFRYHHLFQDILQSQLKQRCSSEEIAALHLRAGEWFAENGIVDEAIRHKLAGGDVIGAEQLFGQNRQLMLNNNRWHVFEKWLSIFPENVLRQQPELLLAKVWVHYFNYEHALIPPMLDVVESLLNDDPKKQSLYGEIDLFRGVICFMRGDLNSLEYIEDALERIPVAHHMVRGFAEIYFGLAGQMQGQQNRVVQVLSDLLNDPSLENSRKLRVLTSLVWIHMISGDLAVATAKNKQLRDIAHKYNSAAFITWASYNRGLIHFSRNELAAAIHHFSQAVDFGDLMLRRAHVDCMAGLTLAYQAMQQADKATATLERLFELIHPLNDPILTGIAHSCRARLSLMRGEAAIAPGGPKIDPEADVGVMAIWLEVPVITRCRVLLTEGSDAEFKEAEKKLQEYQCLNRSHHNTLQMIGIMALLSLAIYRQGRSDEAVDILEQAVCNAEPGGLIRPFIELGAPMADLLKRLQKQNVAAGYIEKLLAAFSAEEQVVGPEAADHSVAPAHQHLRPSTTSQPLVEPLTNRELDVLELLAQRLQNKEIAEKLFVTTETVKGHLKNIYQKLSANNRREAVAKAKKLRIL